MSSSIFEKLPGEPILVLTQPAGSDVLHDMREGLPGAVRLVSEQPEPLFLIIDISQVPMRIDQVNTAANMSAKDTHDFLHHPNIREVVFVTPVVVIRLALRVMSSTAYHELNMSVVDTLDEALAHCRRRDTPAA